LVKQGAIDDALKRGNISKRFNLPTKRAKGNIARDRFAFEQALQGHDCVKIRRDGDFIVQKRDFFGNKIGESTVYDVKTVDSKLTEAQRLRRRRLGRNRYRVARY
jgi:hypothetical protein